MDAVYWAGAYAYNPNLAGEMAFIVTTRASPSNITVNVVELSGSSSANWDGLLLGLPLVWILI